MERQELLLAFWVLLVAILLSTFRSKFHGKLPPSPLALPFIGHLHLLDRRLHKALAQLSSKYGPYMMLKFGSCPVLIASTAKAAKEVLKTNDLAFASRPQNIYGRILTYDCQDLVMAPYGKYWRDTRKLCTLELFTPKQAAHFRPLREAEVSAVVEQLRKAAKAGSSVDMREMLTAFNFGIASSMITGKNSSSSAFRELIAEREELTSGAAIGNYMPWLMWLDSSLPKLKKNHKKVDEWIEEEVAAKRLQKDQERSDFIDVMLQLCHEGKLQHTTMKALVLDVMTAGTDTSAAASEWVMAELVKNPWVMSRLQKELEDVVGRNNKVDESHLDRLQYLQAVVKETFRLHPPAPLLLPHESMQECELEHRFIIPTGTQLFVNVYAIGRDPEVWGEDVGQFVPERFLGSSIDVKGQDYELLPFGSGRRSCPGINLALPVVHLMIASLVHEFEWHLPSGEELDMIEGYSFLLRLARPLVLAASVRGM